MPKPMVAKPEAQQNFQPMPERETQMVLIKQHLAVEDIPQAPEWLIITRQCRLCSSTVNELLGIFCYETCESADLQAKDMFSNKGQMWLVFPCRLHRHRDLLDAFPYLRDPCPQPACLRRAHDNTGDCDVDGVAHECLGLPEHRVDRWLDPVHEVGVHLKVHGFLHVPVTYALRRNQALGGLLNGHPKPAQHAAGAVPTREDPALPPGALQLRVQ
mmetsp:Transcript_107930/g.315594  ORF Transcript_107930/g.315594 Transcript_107930/m.315594 type:complete len:215 (-) Transcript_107930:897-1541(-)